jgi:SAM-dependent methyltransferase
MDFSNKIKKAFRLDTYTSDAGNRNLSRIRWAVRGAPDYFRTLLKVYSNRDLREQLRKRQEKLKLEYLFARIDMPELDRILTTYRQGDQSNWKKYLDPEKWLNRSVQQARRLGLTLNPPREVLDLGCGAGYFLFLMRELGARVLGVDLDDDPIFNDMIRLFGIERVGYRITRCVRLPEFGGRRFDLITAWMICFNNHTSKENIWTAGDWDFFLNDMADRLTTDGRLVLSLNPQLDGRFYSKEIEKLFLKRADLVDGRVVIFSKGRLDATTTWKPLARKTEAVQEAASGSAP